MKHAASLGLAFALIGSLVVGPALADGPDPSLYVGVKSCKMCHKKPEEGEQFDKWLAGPHAKAFERLATPEAKEVAAKLGIADPQQSGACLKCHSTAYNFSETLQVADLPVEDGVSCESCHGPGANYKKKEIMKDRDQAIAGGMIYPALEKSCTKCHNDQNPTWDPNRYTLKDGSKAGFDPEQAYEKIKHERPAE